MAPCLTSSFGCRISNVLSHTARKCLPITDKDFDTLWRDLVHRSNQSETNALSEPERNFYAVNLLRGSVPRSGFIGYFENFDGSTITDAHRGLRALQLISVLELFEKAQTKILGDRPLPTGTATIDIFPPSLSEEEYLEASDKLDAELTQIEEDFYTLDEEIWQALCSYAEANRLNPKGQLR